MTLSTTSHDAQAASRATFVGSPEIGDLAPDFEPYDDEARPFSLRNFRGSPVVLAFSSSHWDPAAREQVENYNRLIARLPGLAGARLLRIGANGPWRELGFADAQLSIPVIADGGAELATRYGVYDEAAVFVIDAHGVVRWRHVAGDPLPTRDELAAALAPRADEVASSDGVWTRREFVATALAASFAIAFLPLTRRAELAAQSLSTAKLTRADTMPVTLEVNGKTLTLQLEPRVTLLDALREYAGMTGSKKGCDHGQCGACTVHVEGRRVLSCLSFAVMQQGKPITTIEGLAQSVGATGDALHPMQEAFLSHDGFQCGYCTPGQIMSACAMVKEPWGREDGDVREAMSGNICRCGAYPNIVAAIQEVRRGSTTTDNGTSSGAAS
ncbi:MAG TPA: 2Fe-2S iron-sulfur cluster-binding protein [Gemmatimonadaceae bacterium]|nr:2Fe-2S iron-sulfur cluster-binding protein [Gemmatimonadaceae bacterium]